MARSLMVSVLLAASVLTVYGQVAEFEFVDYDDPKFVSQNPHINQGLNAESVIWAFTGNVDFWRPISLLSHMLDCQIFGLEPAGHHVVNMLLHLANTLLLLGVLQYMTARFWPSVLVASLFALHPLHVESVAWVAERKDLLSALFAFAAVWAYLIYARGAGLGWYVLTGGLFALALMSKPMVVTLPAVLLLLDFWPLHRTTSNMMVASESAGSVSQNNFVCRSWFGLVLEKLPLFGLSAISSWITFRCQQQVDTVTDLDTLPMHLRLANGVVAYVWYLVKTVWPVDLAAIYLHPYFPGGTPWLAWQIGGSILIVLVITLLAIIYISARFLVVGWFWYLGTMVPVIGLIQVGMHAYADRYAYIPQVGLFLIIVWSIAGLLQRWGGRTSTLHPVMVLVVVGVLGACTVRAWSQTRYWKDTGTLFGQALQVQPDNHIARAGMGKYYLSRQEADLAIAEYVRVLQVDPNWDIAHFNLAVAYEMNGQLNQATNHYRESIRSYPRLVEGHMKLARILEQTNEFDEAIVHYQKAVDLRPTDSNIYFDLGVAFHKRGNLDKASARYREALQLEPAFAEAAVNLARILVEQERLDEAMKHYRIALSSRSGLAPELHQDVLNLNRVAVAYASEGQFAAALHTADCAVELASVTGAKMLASQIQQRLQRYRQGRP